MRSPCCAAWRPGRFSSASAFSWSDTIWRARRAGVFVMSRNTRSGMQLSIVVPLFNEVSTIDELHRRLTAVLFLIGIRSEIIYVDDGSSDGTVEALQAIEGRYEQVRVIRLARNYGQTAALAAGFDAAAGEVIVAMDGDLQHAPEEIPKLLAKLAEGYDIVSGWRADRELADGEAVGRVAARLRDDVQGLSCAGDQADPALWRSASLHPGAGELGRRSDCRGSDRQHRSSTEPIALRSLADVARRRRSHDRAIPPAVRDAAAAPLRPDRLRERRRRHRRRQ